MTTETNVVTRNTDTKVINKPGRNREAKCVKSRRIAYELRKKGYTIISVEPNRFNPKYDVYFFKLVPGLAEDLERLCEEQRKRKEDYSKTA